MANKTHRGALWLLVAVSLSVCGLFLYYTDASFGEMVCFLAAFGLMDAAAIAIVRHTKRS